ncbi:hypothetical protein KTJ32_17870 [Acinetobacter gyllenbergii]|uniref:hypothetical protein n=1 Tax=Acinetobacter gyllenbergii TaxID=134534 RepID=UPI0021D33061|nr:hypothetical protein [Acinetobacter gyllenbergii]MCU4582866.1 hypothetical protein [Acinetobacter gyllenbergii]
MKFKPFERLLSAKDILEKCEKNQATFRSVIHQSYYAAFNQLKNEVENRLFYPVDSEDEKSSVHKAYLDACINKQDNLRIDHSEYSNLDNVIKDFKRLRGLRRISDYELQKIVNKGEADLSIQLSHRVFDSIEKLA